jgi:glycerophosphoryl diester phosphodiesterase
MWPPLKISQQRGRGEVREPTLASIDQALQEGAEGIALDAQVDSLSEILPWVSDQKCMAFVTLNNSTPGEEARVVKEIGVAGVRDLVRVVSRDLPGLRRLRRFDQKIHLGLYIDGSPPAIREAKTLGAEVLLPHWKTASPSFIQRAHRASMLVIPWTVNSPSLMLRTIMDGADGIITNCPAILTQTVARLQSAGRDVHSRRPDAIGGCYD